MVSPQTVIILHLRGKIQYKLVYEPGIGLQILDFPCFIPFDFQQLALQFFIVYALT